MTPDANRLPGEEEWAVWAEINSEGKDDYPDYKKLGAAISTTVRALVRATLMRYWADHGGGCPLVGQLGMESDEGCTCGLAALLAVEEAPRG